MDNQEQIIHDLIQLNGMMADQIEALRSENSILRDEIGHLKQDFSAIVNGQKTILETISRNQHEVKMLGETMTRSIDNLPYEIGKGSVLAPKVTTIEATVDLLIHSRASICRFGDGEFSIMMGCSRQGFQHQDDLLAKRLTEVVKSNHENCLIAIADNYSSLENYSNMSKNEIRYYMTKEVRMGHISLLEPERVYYNAYITTPYMLYADRDTDQPKKRFDKLKQIWEKRDIIIVEGCLSRLGVGNDLFDGANSIRRILCPAEHAFDRYNEILEEATKLGNSLGKDNVIYIIALGPTATVLAYDLFTQGFQAMDLGHIDNDYEYYIHHATDRYAIPGKYVNNVTKIDQVENINNKTYEGQIEKRIY